MPTLSIHMNAETAWPELRDKQDKIIHLGNGSPSIQVGILEGGMTSGRPSLMIRIDLPDGKFVLAETSARLFCIAARAIMAKYPDLFDGD